MPKAKLPKAKPDEDCPNPLLALWEELYPRGGYDSSLRFMTATTIKSWFDEARPHDIEEHLLRFTCREPACHRYSWAIPTDAALSILVRYSPIVEVGAGTGYWAGQILVRGGDIIAYDISPPGPTSDDKWAKAEANFWHAGTELWFPVLYGGPEKVENHPDRTLFLCWPPYADPMAADCLRNYKGKTVIYIGEGAGGCTGDEAFHDMLERDWEDVEEVALPQWEGIHDRMWVYRRKARGKKKAEEVETAA